MLSEIPKILTIGPFEIKVLKKKDLILERNSFGEYHPKLQEIWIDEGNNDQQEYETFIHEVVEAVNGIFNLQLEHDKIQVLSIGIAQALKDC